LPGLPLGGGFLTQISAASYLGLITRTEIGRQSIGVDCCRKRNKPWRACRALRSALAGAPFWLYAGGVAPCPEPRGLKARRPVFRQVINPRLPGPFPGNGFDQPNRKTVNMQTILERPADSADAIPPGLAVQQRERETTLLSLARLRKEAAAELIG